MNLSAEKKKAIESFAALDQVGEAGFWSACQKARGFLRKDGLDGFSGFARTLGGAFCAAPSARRRLPALLAHLDGAYGPEILNARLRLRELFVQEGLSFLFLAKQHFKPDVPRQPRPQPTAAPRSRVVVEPFKMPPPQPPRQGQGSPFRDPAFIGRLFTAASLLLVASLWANGAFGAPQRPDPAGPDIPAVSLKRE